MTLGKVEQLRRAFLPEELASGLHKTHIHLGNTVGFGHQRGVLIGQVAVLPPEVIACRSRESKEDGGIAGARTLALLPLPAK